MKEERQICKIFFPFGRESLDKMHAAALHPAFYCCGVKIQQVAVWLRNGCFFI